MFFENKITRIYTELGERMARLNPTATCHMGVGAKAYHKKLWNYKLYERNPYGYGYRDFLIGRKGVM